MFDPKLIHNTLRVADKERRVADGSICYLYPDVCIPCLIFLKCRLFSVVPGGNECVLVFVSWDLRALTIVSECNLVVMGLVVNAY